MGQKLVYNTSSSFITCFILLILKLSTNNLIILLSGHQSFTLHYIIVYFLFQQSLHIILVTYFREKTRKLEHEYV